MAKHLIALGFSFRFAELDKQFECCPNLTQPLRILTSWASRQINDVTMEIISPPKKQNRRKWWRVMLPVLSQLQCKKENGGKDPKLPAERRFFSSNHAFFTDVKKPSIC
ncbi:MAG: hypothetical protein IJX94_03345 [Clostridia bacterium]|nr:hypothetical protein [Clostridia bacterium]